MGSNYLIYIAEQVIGHSRVFYSEICNQKSFHPIKQITANYPTKVEKPCNMRIYDFSEESYFLVMWSVEGKRESSSTDSKGPVKWEKICEEVEERIKQQKRGHISVHLKNLDRASYRYFYSAEKRKKFRKRIRAKEVRLKFKNMVIIPEKLFKVEMETEFSRELKDELCLQIGCYLKKDGIFDDGSTYQLFKRYVRKHFPVYWNRIKGTVEEDRVFEYLCTNFTIPIFARSFRNYLAILLYGFFKTSYRKEQLHQNGPPKQSLGSTAYYLMNQLGVKKIDGKYEITPEVEEKLYLALEKRSQREELNEIAKHIEYKTGIKYKSVLRYVQRLRKDGTTEADDILRYLAGKYLPELTERNYLEQQ